MKKMLAQPASDQLYTLFAIFQILADSEDHQLLSSPIF